MHLFLNSIAHYLILFFATVIYFCQDASCLKKPRTMQSFGHETLHHNEGQLGMPLNRRYLKKRLLPFSKHDRRQAQPKNTVLPSKYRYGKHRKNKSGPRQSESDTPSQNGPSTAKPEQHVELSHFNPQLFYRKKLWTLSWPRRIFSAFAATFSITVEALTLTSRVPLDIPTKFFSVSLFLALTFRAGYFVQMRVYHRAYMTLVGYILPLTSLTALLAYRKPKYSKYLLRPIYFKTFAEVKESLLADIQAILGNTNLQSPAQVHSLNSDLQFHYGTSVPAYPPEVNQIYEAILDKMEEVVKKQCEDAVMHNKVLPTLEAFDQNLLADYPEAMQYVNLLKHLFEYQTKALGLMMEDFHQPMHFIDGLKCFLELYQDCWLTPSEFLDPESKMAKEVCDILSRLFSKLQPVFHDLKMILQEIKKLADFTVPFLQKVGDLLKDRPDHPDLSLLKHTSDDSKNYYSLWLDFTDAAIFDLQSLESMPFKPRKHPERPPEKPGQNTPSANSEQESNTGSSHEDSSSSMSEYAATNESQSNSSNESEHISSKESESNSSCESENSSDPL